MKNIIIGIAVGILLGMALTFFAQKYHRANVGMRRALLDELYAKRLREGELTEWIYSAREQHKNDMELFARDVRELAYIFSVASIGITIDEQEKFVCKLRDLRHVLGFSRSER